MKKLFALSLIVLLSSCASIVDGSTQKIAVNSSPQNADCNLANESGSKRVTTPGQVTVARSKSDLMVECVINGYGASRKLVKSEVNNWAWGNLIGGVGIIWDGASGASWKYPEKIDMIIERTQNSGYGGIMPIVGVPQVETEVQIAPQEIPVQINNPSPQMQQQMQQQMMQQQQLQQQDWRRDNTLQPPSRM